MRDYLIIEKIQELYENGHPITPDHLIEIGLDDVVEAAIQSFGKWEILLIACGLESVEWRGKPRVKLSKEEVLIGVKMLHRRLGSECLPASQAKKVDRDLVLEAQSYFGTWPSAIVASGFLPLPPKDYFAQCRECGAYLEVITVKHLESHGITESHYLKKHNLAKQSMESPMNRLRRHRDPKNFGWTKKKAS